MAWHYTVMMHFESIIMSEIIQPKALDVAPDAKPVAWFSRNPYWEKSANRRAIDPKNGDRIALTMWETRQAGGGLVRFGIDATKLLQDQVLWRRARIEDDARESLVAEGVRHGADPSEWCGSVKPVPVERLVIESLDDSYRWQTFKW
ncbi:hypothetical protein GQ57_17795 [Burkholderia sp. MSh2]|nr:hypothetical protein GQ57_17795 [Burkholderia sp. MSh2]KFG93388.1 hypothetical protein GQ56_0131965 [Burkholderia paludis]